MEVENWAAVVGTSDRYLNHLIGQLQLENFHSYIMTASATYWLVGLSVTIWLVHRRQLCAVWDQWPQLANRSWAAVYEPMASA